MTPYVHNIGRWADFLREKREWNSAINTALDKIGLTDPYIVALAGSPRKGSRVKAIKDNIWGMVEFEPHDLPLLDCPIVQRLRHIHQLGFSYLTYPGATHSRFEHTVGVYHVVCLILEAARRTKEVLVDESYDYIQAHSYERNGPESTLIRHAALLHDIGHGAFSHASEDYFLDRERNLTIGAFTIKDFKDDFRSHYYGLVPGTRPITASRESKKLTEIAAVAIIISERFINFYAAACNLGADDARQKLHKIGALILGDPIAESDRALPAILSGPFDADKIDYMLRDANSCGISLGIDVSRLFFRAGIYEIRGPEAFSAEMAEDPIAATLPTKLFLLDQSGVDAIREMGMGRLSLYTRVYHHQLTRNAEAQFHGELARVNSAGNKDYRFTSDFLEFWTLSDSSIQERMHSYTKSAGSSPPRADIWTRNLLKRSACFTSDLILGNDPSWPKGLSIFSDVIDGARHKALQDIHNEVGDPGSNSRLVELISVECASIREALQKAGAPLLPDDPKPSELLLVGMPTKKEPTLPEALVLRPGMKVGKVTSRIFSYYESGRIQEKRGYLFSPGPWREIALLAFQKVLFREFRTDQPDTVCIAPTLASPHDLRSESSAGASEYELKFNLTIKRYFRPILDIRCAAYESGIPWERVQSIQHTIERTYSAFPLLLPVQRVKPNQNLDNLRRFLGEGGWSINRMSVADRPDDPLNAFVTQFPPHLRNDALRMIESIKLLDRVTLPTLLDGAISTATKDLGSSKVRIVPLSPSSGHLVRTYLKDKYQNGLSHQIHSSLIDALQKLEHNECICIVDDNIASGTQASRQLRLWFGEEPEEPPSSANYFVTPLPEDCKRKLIEGRVAFAFAIGSQPGCDVLARVAKKLNVNPLGIAFGSPVDEVSGKEGLPNAIVGELREFLRRVGIGLIHDQVRPTEEGVADECSRKALGYDNMEALMITDFNVPTSTYTALWCPGTYSPIGDPHTKEFVLPWRPLFIRAGKLRDIVLF